MPRLIVFGTMCAENIITPCLRDYCPSRCVISFDCNEPLPSFTGTSYGKSAGENAEAKNTILEGTLRKYRTLSLTHIIFCWQIGHNLRIFVAFWWNIVIYALCRILVKCSDLRIFPSKKFRIPGTKNYYAALLAASTHGSWAARHSLLRAFWYFK